MTIKAVRRRRPAPDTAKIAARVQRFKAGDEHACSAGVRPLNRGFFELERLRARTGAKRAAVQKRQPRK